MSGTATRSPAFRRLWPHRGGPRIRRLLALAVAVAGCLSLAGVASAAFHTTAGVNHGIGSTTGGGLGAGSPYASASTAPFGPSLRAGMYHLRDDGGWNLQCVMEGYNSVSCAGDWGSTPCRKYAWTSAGNGFTMAWHGMNGSGCP